ncbi:thiamine-phosphate pyrophosphorylase [bacterium]|nr:thiamine-phosphate pyrophosphorylase [bacterium]
MKMQNKYRILDANLNRVREGLRVIEDVARFLYNDEKLCKKVRALRHNLSKITKSVYPRLVKSREPEKDVGLSIKEGKRSNIKDIVSANFRRVEEGIRVLEEFSRLISADAGDRFKKIRFKVYGMEKEITTRIS